jgi:hypothetical protein
MLTLKPDIAAALNIPQHYYLLALNSLVFLDSFANYLYVIGSDT